VTTEGISAAAAATDEGEKIHHEPSRRELPGNYDRIRRLPVTLAAATRRLQYVFLAIICESK